MFTPEKNTAFPSWLFYTLGGLTLLLVGLITLKWYWLEGHPGSCRIVSEVQCRLGRFVSYEGQLIGVGFSLPKGTKLYAPFDGVWTTTGRARFGPNAYEAADLDITAPGDAVPRTVDIVGALTDPAPSGTTLRRGAILGRATQEKVSVSGESYTVVLSLSALDPTVRYFVPTRETLSTLFPYVEE